MKITEITVSYGRTQSLESYRNVRPSITLKAEIADGDDPAAVRAQLLAEAKAAVHEEVDLALEDDDRPARYSLQPRYRVIITRELGGHWTGYVRQEPPEQLLIIVPDGALPDRGADGNLTWWTALPGRPRGARLWHVMQIAEAYLADHDRTRRINCADGDLSRIPAWVLEPAQLEKEPDRRYRPDDESEAAVEAA
jgi:hypothetical protein